MTDDAFPADLAMTATLASCEAIAQQRFADALAIVEGRLPRPVVDEEPSADATRDLAAAFGSPLCALLVDKAKNDDAFAAVLFSKIDRDLAERWWTNEHAAAGLSRNLLADRSVDRETLRRAMLAAIAKNRLCAAIAAVAHDAVSDGLVFESSDMIDQLDAGDTTTAEALFDRIAIAGHCRVETPFDTGYDLADPTWRDLWTLASRDYAALVERDPKDGRRFNHYFETVYRDGRVHRLFMGS